MSTKETLRSIDAFDLPQVQIELDLTDFGSIDNLNKTWFNCGVIERHKINALDQRGMLYICENGVYIQTYRDPEDPELDQHEEGYAGHVLIRSDNKQLALEMLPHIVNNASIKGTGDGFESDGIEIVR